MFDARLAAWIQPAIDGMAGRLSRRGVQADSLTWLGFAIGLSGSVLIANQHHLTALLLLALSRVLDALDGAVARQSAPTDRGGFLDITLDFIFYASVPLAFAVAAPNTNALAAATLLTAFMATAASFLAYAAIAANAEKRGKAVIANKSLVFLGGLAEALETYVCFALMCALPQHFAPLAYGFASVCAITAITRIYAGWRDFT